MLTLVVVLLALFALSLRKFVGYEFGGLATTESLLLKWVGWTAVWVGLGSLAVSLGRSALDAIAASDRRRSDARLFEKIEDASDADGEPADER